MSGLRDRATAGGEALALSLALVLAAGPARADAPHVETPSGSSDGAVPVLVLPTVVSGELTVARQREFEDTLRAGLGRGGFVVRTAADGSSARCETGTCQAQQARAVDARYAVSMTIEVDRRDYVVALDVVDAADGRSVAQSEERCEVCGQAEIAGVIDSQAAAISARLDALALEPPTLTFDSTPPGVMIRIDGELVGETPFDRVVEPGVHRVRAEKVGFISEEREIKAVAGVQTQLGFDLEPQPVSDATIRARARRRTWGWVGLGVGAAAVVTGGSLVVLHDRPNRSRCSGSNVDADGDCKFVYATRVPGIVTGLVGVALVATGLGLVLRNRRSDRRRTVGLGVGIGLRSVSVRGRF